MGMSVMVQDTVFDKDLVKTGRHKAITPHLMWSKRRSVLRVTQTCRMFSTQRLVAVKFAQISNRALSLTSCCPPTWPLDCAD